MNQILSYLQQPFIQTLIAKIEPTFKSAPHLPKGISEFLVKVAPWLCGLSGIMSVIDGLSAMLNPNRYNELAILGDVGISPVYVFLSGVLQLAVGLILVASFSALRQRDYRGWVAMVWTMLIGTAQSLLAIIFISTYNIAGLIIGTVIGLYLLFELKPFYTVNPISKVTKTPKAV